MLRQLELSVDSSALILTDVIVCRVLAMPGSGDMFRRLSSCSGDGQFPGAQLVLSLVTQQLQLRGAQVQKTSTCNASPSPVNYFTVGPSTS